MIVSHEPQFAWALWSLFLLGIWAAIYALLKKQEGRREMLIVSAWTSLLGFTEPFFVPSYWNPPSLFDLAHRTRFDIESFIFSFAIGGIVVVIYEWLFANRHIKLSIKERMHVRHRHHFWALVSAPVIFFVLLATPLNHIYDAFIALVAGGILTWYCRPDLKKKMIASAFLFLSLYILYFLALTAVYPGYVKQVWNLSAISGILIIGIPLEELLFALGLGFMWSSVYEHLAWKKIKMDSDVSKIYKRHIRAFQ